jgi:predicted SnoaL-like aldol condensation-catalyzing enzyme
MRAAQQDRSVSPKDSAIAFLRLAAEGKVDESYTEYAAPDLRHHNPHFSGEADALAAGMRASAEEHPDKVLEIQRALEDGDLVAIHSRVRLDQDTDVAAIHLFRFEDGRIAELWDITEPIPADSQTGTGPSDKDQCPREESNLRTRCRNMFAYRWHASFVRPAGASKGAKGTTTSRTFKYA